MWCPYKEHKALSSFWVISSFCIIIIYFRIKIQNSTETFNVVVNFMTACLGQVQCKFIQHNSASLLRSAYNRIF